MNRSELEPQEFDSPEPQADTLSPRYRRRAKVAAVITGLGLPALAGGIFAKSAEAGPEGGNQNIAKVLSDITWEFDQQGNAIENLSKAGNPHVKKFHDKVGKGFGSPTYDSYMISRRSGTYHGKPAFTEYIYQIAKLQGSNNITYHWEIAQNVIHTDKKGDPVKSKVEGGFIAASQQVIPLGQGSYDSVWNFTNSPSGSHKPSPNTKSYTLTRDKFTQYDPVTHRNKPVKPKEVAAQFNNFYRITEAFIKTNS